MVFIDSLRNFIRGLDKKEFVKYAGLYIGLCGFIAIGIIVRHIYLIRDAQAKITQINKARRSVQEILTKFSKVEQQRNKVAALLKKDKNFYIQKFFQDLSHKTHVFSNVKENLSQEKLEDGYTEESLNIHLTQVTTKQLCELLQDIENEARVYIKFVDITSMGTTKKINVKMSIATLIPQVE